MSNGYGKSVKEVHAKDSSTKDVKAGLFPRRHLSFSGKVLICVLGLLVLSNVTMNLFYMHSQQKAFRQEIEKDGHLLSGMVASNARLGLFARDDGMLAASLQTVFAMEGVIGACVYDNRGELLGLELRKGWEDEAVCRRPEPLSVDHKILTGKHKNVIRTETSSTIEFWSPVLAGPIEFTEESLYYGDGDDNLFVKSRNIGFVGVVFDKGPIQKSIQDILVRNLFILFLFLLIGFASAFYIIQGVSRPLKRLIAKIGSHGNSVDTRDELGMLADTFSGLLTTISDSFATINVLKEGLEKKVDELEHEIGKRRQTEADLRESEEKFKGISESIADGVAIILDGEFAWYNKAFHSILGYGCNELHDIDPEDIFPRPDMAPGSENNGFSRHLVHSRKKDGIPLILEVTAQKIIYNRNDAVQLIIRDITESEETEKQRKELEVKALGQSKLASLGKIATSVAHEINQPLSYIKIANESLLRDLNNQQLKSEDLKECCHESLRQIDRITFITNHLRNFGRADTSEFTSIRLPDVLANSLTLMGENLRLANISLLKVIEEDLPPVRGNSVKLEQVLINLFQNSMDAITEYENKEIHIIMRRSGNAVEIIFADTGPGIPPGARAHIFEPFFTTKRLEERSGLGLGIVNSIIQEHRGTIIYQDSEGYGATFVITLPMGA